MAQSRSGHRILVIDDDPDIRTILRLQLEEAGYEVVEAVHGRDALRRFRATPSALAVVKIFKPGKEGLDTVLALKQEELAPKIIAITDGVGMMDFLSSAKVFGVDRAFRKPFNLDDLVKAVDEELQAARDHQG